MPERRPKVAKKLAANASPKAESPSITGAAFWELMDSWKVPDEAALRLIAGPPLTEAGKRPRFRLTGEQAERFILLREIDRHLVDLFGKAATWVVRSNAAPEFSGRTPLEHMLRNGRRGISDVLHFLKLQTFKASL